MPIKTAVKFCPFCGTKVDPPFEVTLQLGSDFYRLFTECVPVVLTGERAQDAETTE